MDSTEELLDLMRRSGVSITRQNYIDIAWGDPLPDPWTAEHESELPKELQDWSLFETVDGRLVFREAA